MYLELKAAREAQSKKDEKTVDQKSSIRSIQSAASNDSTKKKKFKIPFKKARAKFDKVEVPVIADQTIVKLNNLVYLRKEVVKFLDIPSSEAGSYKLTLNQSNLKVSRPYTTPYRLSVYLNGIDLSSTTQFSQNLKNIGQELYLRNEGEMCLYMCGKKETLLSRVGLSSVLNSAIIDFKGYGTIECQVEQVPYDRKFAERSVIQFVTLRIDALQTEILSVVRFSHLS